MRVGAGFFIGDDCNSGVGNDIAMKGGRVHHINVKFQVKTLSDFTAQGAAITIFFIQRSEQIKPNSPFGAK